MSNRVYSEEEVARLIRRAVELESNRSGFSRSDDQKGLTMQDLEKIAADSGIDPELMHHAADELDRQDTLDNLKESTRVNRSEIVAEHWITGKLTNEIIDDLIIELNHRFGTSEDDINWWDRLWNDYSGKPLIKRTATSADWRYTDEMEFYTSRVLIQQRGDKLRIRISKRQGWNLSWNSEGSYIFLGVFCIFLFSIIGSVVGFTALNSPLLGVLAGLALAALVVPISISFSKRRLNGHISEIKEIAENLVYQAKQLMKESSMQDRKKSKTDRKDSGIKTIEIESDPVEKTDTKSGIKNQLRE
ncbi:hypothetical protein BH23BAC3_BH23BAC3_10340 [soil metagenome]